tara:strand:- start:244 stop:483 length:240 start_codon:yes stop_codon:yes gene_type:complete
MPVGYPKDQNKKQEYNGAGMRSLSPARRTEVMKTASAKTKEKNRGWPESVQKEGDDKKHTYREADDEWARRMAATRSRK